MFRILVILCVVACGLFLSCGDDTGEVIIEEPDCLVGAPCDDLDNTTDSDRFNVDCDCVGRPNACSGIGDADGDGVCSDVDCDDNDALNTNSDLDGDGICGDIDCDDENASVTELDADGDGYCESEDCSDAAPNYHPGASCDDGDPLTLNDIVTPECTCQGEYPYGTMIDPRDGQEYLTIEIGVNTWMAENLNFETGVSWCYDEDPINCSIYGRMYNAPTAPTACPVGWHLPSHSEWQSLINHLGGLDDAGGTMKAVSDLWNTPNEGATNSSGFTGLPGGCYSIVSASFNMLNRAGFWWSSTPTGQGNNIYAPSLSHVSNEVLEPDGHPGDGYSIRCVKD